jgi:cephalosporin hydroxylase
MNAQELSAIFPRKFWLEESEVPWLYNKAGSAESLIVEIGAAYGGSAALWLLGKRAGVRVVSIDPFVTDSMEGFQASAKECRDAVYLAAGECLYYDWTLIEQHSAEIAKLWSDPIGLLYLDGDHSYEGVKQDFELWSPHLLPGASVILHDSRRLPGADPRIFARGWPGPTRLVDDLVTRGRCEIVDTCFSMAELRIA